MHRALRGLTIHISPIGDRRPLSRIPFSSIRSTPEDADRKVPAQPYSTPLFRKQTAGGDLRDPPHCHARGYTTVHRLYRLYNMYSSNQTRSLFSLCYLTLFSYPETLGSIKLFTTRPLWTTIYSSHCLVTTHSVSVASARIPSQKYNTQSTQYTKKRTPKTARPASSRTPIVPLLTLGLN